jgi:hypothetical protein
LDELGIQQIPAYSPQAEGRIERVWRTFQDRLVSKLRLVHATTLEQANAVLARLLRPVPAALCPPRRPGHARFSLPATPLRSGPRLSPRYQRVASPDHVVSFGAHSLALPPLPDQPGYARQIVELSHQLDGTLRIYLGDDLLLALPLPLQETEDRRSAPRTAAQKRKTPTTVHLQSLWPPGSRGRYLKLIGG